MSLVLAVPASAVTVAVAVASVVAMVVVAVAGHVAACTVAGIWRRGTAVRRAAAEKHVMFKARARPL